MPRSNLVKPPQTWSNLVKLGQILGNVLQAPSRGSFDMVGPYRVISAWSNLGQTWSTPFKLRQSWSNLPELREICSGPRLEVLLMW